MPTNTVCINLHSHQCNNERPNSRQLHNLPQLHICFSDGMRRVILHNIFFIRSSSLRFSFQKHHQCRYNNKYHTPELQKPCSITQKLNKNMLSSVMCTRSLTITIIIYKLYYSNAKTMQILTSLSNDIIACTMHNKNTANVLKLTCQRNESMSLGECVNVLVAEIGRFQR